MAPAGAGDGSDGCPEDGDGPDGDDAVLLDGESEPPVNMITATTATITTSRAAAEANRMFLRRPGGGSAGGAGVGGTDVGGVGVRYCVAAANVSGGG